MLGTMHHATAQSRGAELGSVPPGCEAPCRGSVEGRTILPGPKVDGQTLLLGCKLDDANAHGDCTTWFQSLLGRLGFAAMPGKPWSICSAPLDASWRD